MVSQDLLTGAVRVYMFVLQTDGTQPKELVDCMRCSVVKPVLYVREGRPYKMKEMTVCVAVEITYIK